MKAKISQMKYKSIGRSLFLILKKLVFQLTRKEYRRSKYRASKLLLNAKVLGNQEASATNKT